MLFVFAAVKTDKLKHYNYFYTCEIVLRHMKENKDLIYIIPIKLVIESSSVSGTTSYLPLVSILSILSAAQHPGSSASSALSGGDASPSELWQQRGQWQKHRPVRQTASPFAGGNPMRGVLLQFHAISNVRYLVCCFSKTVFKLASDLTRHGLCTS